MNPVDYRYQAMNLIIDPLDFDCPEYEVKRTYINNTRNVDKNYYQRFDNFEINIFSEKLNIAEECFSK
jgi:hypothetical protein